MTNNIRSTWIGLGIGSVIYWLLFLLLDYILLFTSVGLWMSWIIFFGIAFYVLREAYDDNNSYSRRNRYNSDDDTISSVPEINFRKVFTILEITLMVFAFFFITSSWVGGNLSNAENFDPELVYVKDGLPFTSALDGHDLRVVDSALAKKIMDKSNPFGTNTEIGDVHLGHINGKTYWIGVAIYTGYKWVGARDKDKVHGFVAVDFLDPNSEAIIIEQEFEIGESLLWSKDLQRTIHYYDRDYMISGFDLENSVSNAYFSMTEDGDMRLVVPYTVRGSPMFDPDIDAGLFEYELRKKGGTLIYNSDGNMEKDYKNITEAPAYARVQPYNEYWLERQISAWGKGMTNDHDFALLNSWGIVKSSRIQGIDDDVRVIVDPDTKENVQYILLDSSGSETSILKGAIKANTTGLFFYDFTEYNFIDTNTAHEHAEQAIIDKLQTTTHGYKTLLPILYPIVDNATSLDQYAYVMPLQLGDTRFGGIAITDPSDKTGINTVIKLSEQEGAQDINVMVDDAVNSYLAIKEQEISNTTDIAGDLELIEIKSYVSTGMTEFMVRGNYSLFTELKTFIFSQNYLTKDDWERIVFAEIKDILNVNVQKIGELYYVTNIN